MVVLNLFLSSLLNTSSLLICHLFIDGQFRCGHILFDPNVFDGQLIKEIDFVCPFQIPWLITDITRSSLIPWQANDRTDHILQLVLFDRRHLTEQSVQFKDYLTFHRIFAFSTTVAEDNLKNQISEITLLSPIHSPNSLILEFHLKKNVVHVHWILKNEPESHRTEIVIDTEDNTLFDHTFGIFERKRSITIEAFLWFRKPNDYSTHVPIFGHAFLANFFSSTLNASYINTTFALYATPFRENHLIQHQPRKVRNEVAYQYERISDKQAGDYSVALYFDSYYMPPESDKSMLVYYSYPYQSNELVAIFVYGTDFTRQSNLIQSIPESVLVIFSFTLLFIGLASVTLYLVRKKLKLSQSDIISSFIDVMIAFIAGGQLRMLHKFERLFFGILLISAFFITSLFMGEFLDYFYGIFVQKVDTLEELAEINSPIYASGTINFDDALPMLREKIGKNIDFKGFGNAANLSIQHEDSFIYMAEKHRVDNFVYFFNNLERDFDVVPESPGEVKSQFYMKSDQYISERFIKTVDQMTSSLMANGLYQFFLSFSEYSRKIIQRTHSSGENDDPKVLSIEQLRRPMILIICLLGLAFFIFIIEIIWSKWKSNPIVRCRSKS